MARVLVDKNTGVIYDEDRPWLGGNIYGGDPRCLDDAVFDYLIEKFQPKSLVDVGCGEGQLMEYFHLKDIYVRGIDGLKENIANGSDLVREYMILHDYTEGPLMPIYANMVISCEFVEHVHKRYIANYLPQFVYGEVLVFTHAVENQQGYHHVNCENDPYWITLITSLGMKHLEKETAEARALVGDNSFWGTVLIFKNPFL